MILFLRVLSFFLILVGMLGINLPDTPHQAFSHTFYVIAGVAFVITAIIFLAISFIKEDSNE